MDSEDDVIEYKKRYDQTHINIYYELPVTTSPIPGLSKPCQYDEILFLIMSLLCHFDYVTLIMAL